MTPPEGSLLVVRDLTVSRADGAPVVEQVSLELPRAEILALVGESGSGKTTTALALLGHTRPGLHIAGGSVEVQGEELLGRDERALQRLRSTLVAYVPQDPVSASNPSVRIRDQLREVLEGRDGGPATELIDTTLTSVRLPISHDFLRRYPHQLSGGQIQRVAMAAALICRPQLVVMDEPTTGLDVVTQQAVLDEVQRLRDEHGLTIVYVSHNLAVVSSIADRIAVMYAGRIVEEGSTEALFTRPRHPYTRGLVMAVPDHAHPGKLYGMPGVAVGVDERPAGCSFAPRCLQVVARCHAQMPSLRPIQPGQNVRCFEAERTPPPDPTLRRSASARAPAAPLLRVEELEASYGRRSEPVLHEVTFDVQPAEVLAVVGESGSGKTTLARCIAGLHTPAAGRIILDGTDLPARAKARPRALRRRIQLIFQNPTESLNPRHKVVDAIGRPAQVLRRVSRQIAREEAAVLLERVRLPARLAEQYPAELSGGERQRVAIARALAAEPDVLVCDEVTSALDVSVQAAVLELLDELRAALGVSMVFISHDLGVVSAVADRVLVLEKGRICEQGAVHDVLQRPAAPYTRSLLEAAPRPPLSPVAEQDHKANGVPGVSTP